jgi:hypothetical protein
MSAVAMRARPAIGPTTTPAIQALELPPLLGWVWLGAVRAVEAGWGIERAGSGLVGVLV